jgi:hypothetical protein
MCVQDVDVQCVLQFTLLHAAGCALHRHTSRVIHRLEFCHVHLSKTPTPKTTETVVDDEYGKSTVVTRDEKTKTSTRGDGYTERQATSSLNRRRTDDPSSIVDRSSRKRQRFERPTFDNITPAAHPVRVRACDDRQSSSSAVDNRQTDRRQHNDDDDDDRVRYPATLHNRVTKHCPTADDDELFRSVVRLPTTVLERSFKVLSRLAAARTR